MRRVFALLMLLCSATAALAQGAEIGHRPSRNAVAIGYQIGGYSLLGFEVEWRVGDLLGLHFGVGYVGATAGLKVHFGPSKDSSFLNLSWKDGGCGLIEVAALETGGRVPIRPGGFALHGQIGLAYILSIDTAFEDDLFGDEVAPPLMLSMGIGVSF